MAKFNDVLPRLDEAMQQIAHDGNTKEKCRADEEEEEKPKNIRNKEIDEDFLSE